MTDVVVVGAGPAGASLGLRLARAGYDVTLLERSRFPRTKVCGDYLSAGALEGLRALDIGTQVLAGAHPLRSISLRAFGTDLRLRLPDQSAASLPRATLDARLLEHARIAGARLCNGVFLRAHESGARMHIAYRDEHGMERGLTARVLVGADGAWSAVARRAGMITQGRQPGPWAVGGELCDQATSDELCMYVGANGYYARNPLGPHSVNSMLVAPVLVRSLDADAVVAEMTQGRLRFEAEKIHRPVAVGPLRYRAGRVMQGRILLTGDAAELLDPFTGQGVATALALSVPAEQAIADLLHGVPAYQVTRGYTAQWRSIVGPRRTLTRMIESVIRIGFLRARALHGIRQHPQVADVLLASASGHLPARAALTSAVLLQLLAS